MSGQTDQWTVSGPDAFGDFTLASEGEELAKCVVVQNGFRTPDQTEEIAARVHRAVNSHDALVEALEDTKRSLLSEFGQRIYDVNFPQIDAALLLAKGERG